MARLLLLFAIAAVGYYLYRRLTGPAPGRPPAGSEAPPPVVCQCAECGVHAPEQSGVRYQNLFFCTPEHLEAYRRRHGQG